MTYVNNVSILKEYLLIIFLEKFWLYTSQIVQLKLDIETIVTEAKHGAPLPPAHEDTVFARINLSCRHCLRTN